MRDLDLDTLHQVVTELMEETSPDREERVDQAIADVKKDLAEKQAKWRDLTARMAKVDGLTISLERYNGNPSTKLIIEALQRRRENLEADAESIHLAKLVKKLSHLQREKKRIVDNQQIIEDIKERLDA